MTLFLPFQNGKNALFTVETVAERKGPIFAKQTLTGIILAVQSCFYATTSLHLHKYDTIRLLFRLREPCSPRKNLNNWTVCYVVGLSSLSKVKKFLCAIAVVYFCPLSREGSFGLHSTPFKYSSFSGRAPSKYRVLDLLLLAPPPLL